MERVREFLNNGKNVPGNVLSGRYPSELPNKKIGEIDQEAISGFCAPPNCLQEVHDLVKKKEAADENEVSQEMIIKTIRNWNTRKDYADGIVTSLYERISHGSTRQFIGDPVADSLAIVTRANSSILALADGVSWGKKSRLASTCSIYASVTYLNEHLPSCKRMRDVFRHILKAFEKAHQCIVSQQGTMTTLCVGVVVPLLEKNRYGFCVVNVGDSYAYVFNRHYGVKEVTEASHPIDDARDMRHCGGALGPADGCNPDISNLTCSFVIVEKDDLVFLCSDGVSDNFDPEVAKFTPNFNRRTVISLSSNDSSDQEENHKNIERGTCDGLEHTVPEVTLSPPTHPLCSLCHWEDSRRKRKSPEVVVDEKNKRNSPDILTPNVTFHRKDSKIIDFFPKLENFPAKEQRDSTPVTTSSSESDEDDERVLRPHSVCTRCGKFIKRNSEWSILHKDDRKNSVLEYDIIQTENQMKMSTSKSMQTFQPENQTKDSMLDGHHLKSKSFSNVSKGTPEALQLEKEASFSKLQNASSRCRISSQPSVDESTGRKLKEEMALLKNLTPRERREGALERLNEIICQKLEMDGDTENINVGEICAQVVNFVIGNTDQKRTILERVPQSELNRMSSKDRKTHNEQIKKDLEGVPGKLDHASIVCYEVGCHSDVESSVSLDLQKSMTVDRQYDLLPAKKGGFGRAVSVDPNLLRKNTDENTDVSTINNQLYNQFFCNELELF